jgi:hypothetical protein
MMRSSRRRFLQQSALAAVAALAACPARAFGDAPAPAAPVRTRTPLTPGVFTLLPLGSIKPAGWLRRQLEIQANGLSGHLDETWADVGPSSGWLGGTGESWERGPYFLDGLIPLAWQLDDARLKAKARRFLEWTLTHAQANGMIGPASNDDWWPRIVMLKALTQYYEVSGDARVMPVMDRYFRHQLAALPGRPLRDWGKFRWQDEALSVLWLYNRTGEAYLLNLARLLHQQGHDWIAEYANFQYKEKITAEFIKLNEGGGARYSWSEQRAGAQDGSGVVARFRLGRRPRRYCAHAGGAGPLARAAEWNVLMRRTSFRARSFAGVGVMHGGREHVFAGAGARNHGQRCAGRPAGEAGLQCAAGHVHRRYVGSPVQPGAEPGRVQPAPQAVGFGRSRIEPVWAGAEFWLLYRELSPGLAQVHREPVYDFGRLGF